MMLKTILSTTALALMLAAPAWAADENDSKVPMNQLSLADSSAIAKSTVNDAAGNKIGNIESLAVDPQRGQVAYAIISANGKDIAVPWQRLQAANLPQTFVLNADKASLDNAPSVDLSNLAQLGDPQQRQRISAFWDNVPTQQAQTPSAKPEQDREK